MTIKLNIIKQNMTEFQLNVKIKNSNKQNANLHNVI